ncbi:MAG TPA: class II glutamine amidotransferase, partial [Thermoplasmata archaeon]|nr:class II glutamine amidotransferase [Thermoplasmata archaeon]
DRKAGEALVLVAHIRRASPGMSIGAEWSHPFIKTKGDHTWAFAHNGGLASFAHGEDEKVGDSQVLFRTLLGNLDGSDPEQVAKATRATVETIRAEFGYTGLNFLLSDGQSLHAFREYQENGDYYTLYHDHFGEAVLVCSQPILGMRDNLLVKGYLLSAGPGLEVVKTRVL